MTQDYTPTSDQASPILDASRAQANVEQLVAPVESDESIGVKNNLM